MGESSSKKQILLQTAPGDLTAFSVVRHLVIM
jgi:hypothetical protein